MFSKSIFISFLFLLLPIFCQANSDADALFNWAEKHYSEFFSPSDQSSQSLAPWYYRHYSQSQTYVGVNTDNEVYVLGDLFGGMAKIANLSDMQTIMQSMKSCPPQENNTPIIEKAGPGESFVTYVPSQLGNVAIKVTLPDRPRYRDHTQAMVNVATFFTTTAPFYTDLDVTPIGLVHISYIWPGAEEPRTGACSEGIFDHGGPNSIASLRDVVRYALGDLADIEGKTIGQRLEGMTIKGVGLWAFSHPGIAAVNVLSHYPQELNQLAWLVARENPTQDQHSAVELGHFSDSGERVINPIYDFARDYQSGLLNLDYSRVRWAANYVEEEHKDYTGRAYFDFDNNGEISDGDHVLSYRVPQMWGKRYLSRQLTQALKDNGLSPESWPSDLATPEETQHFWPYRTSIERYPLLKDLKLKVMLVYAKRQHVQPLADAASIHSAYDGYSNAGLWVRINPDRSYAEYSLGAEFSNFPDHDAQTEPDDWSQAGEQWGYPDHASVKSATLGTTIGLAAVAEMADRHELNRWEANLDKVLVPFPLK